MIDEMSHWVGRARRCARLLLGVSAFSFVCSAPLSAAGQASTAPVTRGPAPSPSAPASAPTPQRAPAAADTSAGAAPNDTAVAEAVTDATPAPANAVAPPAAPRPLPQREQPQTQADYEDHDPRALTDFKPALDPYGAWVQHPTYGVVWVPHSKVVGTNFAPYVTSGHWEMTEDDQWIWVSDYPFGWVVFHYGRWVWIDGTGWSWVPGRRYAHAWVSWRVPSDDYAYVGWAPLPPRFVWFSGGAVSLWFTPGYPYVFCPSTYLFSPYVYRHIIYDRHVVHRVAPRTRPYHPVERHAAFPRSPSATAARVPANALPQRRTSADPRAAAAAAPRGTPRSADFRRESARSALHPSSVRAAAAPRADGDALQRSRPTSIPRPQVASPPRPVVRDAARAAAPPIRNSSPSRGFAPPARSGASSPPVMRRPQVSAPPPRSVLRPSSVAPSHRAPPMRSSPRAFPSGRGGGRFR